jgi:phosphohistidine swiveling domain-containing protein
MWHTFGMASLKTLRTLNDDDPWMLGEDIPDCDLFFSQVWVSGFANDFGKHVGRMYSKILTLYKGYHLWFYYGEKDSFEVGEYIVRKFIRQPNFTKRVNKGITTTSDRVSAYARRLPEDGLEKFSNRQLWKFYQQWDELHTAFYEWGWIPVSADMFHNNFTNAMKKYLETRNVPEKKFAEVFALLTQPTKPSLIQQEREDFLDIAAAIQAQPKQRKLFRELFRVFEEEEATQMTLAPHTPAYERALEDRAQQIRGQVDRRILRMIEKHYEQNFSIKHMWIGKDGVHTFDHYLKELVKFVGRGSDARKLKAEGKKEFARMLAQRSAAIRRYGIRGKWRILFDAFGDFMVTKIYRRYAQIYLIYRMQPVLDEIARRLKISKMQLRFMLAREVKAALLTGRIDRAELKKRTVSCSYYCEKGREEVFTGKPAKILAKMAAPKKLGVVTELTGQVGCVGRAIGTVKIVIRPSDMEKMKQGDILVSIATDPDIVPAMKKAAAIVTEQGGVTSHAAIVSREMNIPCVIGTKIATRVLKDGDRVEVDANKGIVRKI